MEKKYFIVTYGCQMNIHESEKLAGVLHDFGYTEGHDQQTADLVLFNTCCIRENAEQTAYGHIGNLKAVKKENPNMIICVCGCMTQQKDKAKTIKQKFPFVDIIIGTFNVDSFARILKKKLNQKKAVVEVLDNEQAVCEDITPFRTSYPNAWVNIMYGCNNFCTYCIVPYVRGRERSRKMSHIIAEVKTLVDKGYKEITLLGQNVDSYGNDLNEQVDFADLITALSPIEGKFRLKFMSNHPKDINEKMMLAIKNCKNASHSLHLPVQSGSNNILKAMNRKYTREDYLNKIQMIRRIIPDMAITTDLMVGFPGETDKDFNDTVSLAQSADFYGAYTFVYSMREGTKACLMPNQIPEEIKKQRIMQLVDFQNTKNRNDSLAYIGKVCEILVESYDKKKNLFMGRDDYGRMAYFASSNDIIGQFVNVEIEKAGGISLYGKIVN